MESNESRVKRLFGVLSRYAGDEGTVLKMAQALNYEVDVLREDLNAMQYVKITVGDAEVELLGFDEQHANF